MAKVYLSMGSNVGNRQKFIKQALDSIACFCEIAQISSFYETEPWGKLNQPRFLNLCLAVKTDLSPEKLLSRLKSIENNLGRTKTVKWAEREIDIDILFYDDIVSKSSSLILPHPLVEERAFVLIPLAEIAPGFIHPVARKSINELAEDISAKGVRKLVKIMGIINTTPDSFSDGGELYNEKTIEQKTRKMIDSGVDIIDIGGESTRPGHQKIKASEEIKRVLPAIRAVRKISSALPISVDTQKAQVAQAALEAGATIINDISAFSDKDMPGVIKRFNCQIILMRNRPLDQSNLVDSCKKQFEEIVKNCQDAGIDKDKIILDAGLGFGDLASGDFSSLPGGDPSANTMLTLSAMEYSLGLPVLVGASRKRFLGTMSGQTNAKERLSESLAFAVLAKYSGASIIRVHDVPETIKILNI